MKRKTIKSLLSKTRIVYIKLSNERAAEAFFALAKYEGFSINEELIKTSVPPNCFVKVHEDMTISFPDYRTWAGAMRFHHAKNENGKKVVKIDFEKML